MKFHTVTRVHPDRSFDSRRCARGPRASRAAGSRSASSSPGASTPRRAQSKLWLGALALVAFGAIIAPSSCSCGDQNVVLTLPQKLRIAKMKPAQQGLVRVSLEIPGLLAPTDLAFTDSTHTAVSGSGFVLGVTAPTNAVVVMRAFGRFTPASDEVLIGIAKKSVTINPRSTASFLPVESDWSVSGAPIFDVNGNGKDNVDDLVAGFDPAPPKKVLAVLPDAVQFASGVRPGQFVRQVVVVENVSGLAQQLSPSVVGGQGVSITLIDPTGVPVGGAPRTLAPFTLQPFQEVLLAVTFAPTNEFLVRGTVAINTLQQDENVASSAEIGIIANSDGDPQPAALDYDPGTADSGKLGISAPIIVYPATSLFGGQPIAPGKVQQSDDPNDTVTIPALGVGGKAVNGIPVDLAFLVEIPAKSRLSVALDGLTADAQLGLFLLDANGNLSTAAGETLISTNPGTAAESVQFRNSSATDARRAVIALGRVDVREPGDKSVDAGLPFNLLAQLDSGPEFTDDAPLSATHGDFRGGNDLTLSGVDFEAGATVFIGAHTADRTATTVSDDGSTIHTITPPGTTDDLGTALTVVALNPNGEAATLPSVFTYDAPAPEIDSVSPNTGSTLGGTAVLITGAFFSDANGGPRVLVGAQPATNVALLDANTVAAVIPPAPGGNAAFVTVTVENLAADGSTTDSAGFPFVYVAPAGAAPTIASVSPNTGSTDGLTSITIAGTNFVAGAGVRFGGSVPSEVNVAADGNSITCLTPPKSQPGSVDVIVVNPDGQTATSTAGYAYVTLPPTVIDAQPTTISTLGGTRVFVDGTDFRAGVTANFVQTAPTNVSIAAAGVTFVNDTRLVVTAPTGLGAGNANLVVVNSDGQASSPLALTVVAPLAPPPHILALNPNTVRIDQLGEVDVTGTSFDPATMIAFIDSDALVINNPTPTSFSFTAPQHGTGAAIIRVINGDGQTDSSALVYQDALGAVFQSVSPDVVGALVPGDVVTVAGQNLVNIADAQVHLLNGAGTEFGATLVQQTSTALKVRIDDPLPEAGDYVVRADFSTGSATSPAFAAIAPALLSEQALSPPVDSQPFTVLLQGSALNHTRITTARFVRSGDGVTVALAPTLATDSLVRIDSGGKITQGSWSIFLDYGFTDSSGAQRTLSIAVPDPSGAQGAVAPFVVSGQCGNGALDAGEECDGTVFASGLSCTSFGFFGGTLLCDQNCHARTTQCSSCGDGIIEAGEFEECDGTNFGGKTCNDVVPGSTGTLLCTSQCTINANECSICGNGIVEGAEQCDGNNFNGNTCATLGFNSGQITCDPSTCTLDGALCSTCGNNRCDALETPQNCPQDCVSTCGNGTCDANESCTTCPKDCGGQCTAPFSIALTSGANQSLTFDRDLPSPVLFHVADAGGNPLVGVKLTFAQQSASSLGGNLSPATALTDASGNASSLVTLGRVIGTQTLTVTGTGPDNQLLTGAPLSFSESALDLAPLQVVTIANQPAVQNRTSLLDANGNQLKPAATKSLLSLDTGGLSGLAVRGDGAVFVSDSNNHRVVRIDPDGTMVHVAGSNVSNFGFAGDGGPATASLLNRPLGLALDAQGNLYIVDNGNGRVRKVNASDGKISTFAGVGTSNPSLPNDGDNGLATGAFLNQVDEVAVNPVTQDVFVTCDFSNSIRKIANGTGIITTVVSQSGCTSASGPRAGDITSGGITFDSEGRLVFDSFLSDNGGCVGSGEAILRLEGDGSLSFVAGGGQADGDGIQARGARLFGVTGVAVDAGGNVFYSERASGATGRRIRKVSNVGVLTTAMNTASTQGNTGDGGAATAAQVSVPGGLAFSLVGGVAGGQGADLFVDDGGNHNVRLIRGVGDATAPTFSVAPIGDGQTASVDRGLAIAIGVQVTSGATGIPGLIISFTPPAGGAVEPAQVVTDGSGRATALAFAPRTLGATTWKVDGKALDGTTLPTTTIHANVVDVATNTVFSVVNQRGTPGSISSQAATRTELNLTSNNAGVCVDPVDGTFYVADRNNHRVVHVDNAGTITVAAGVTTTFGNSGDGGPATAALLNSPRGCAVSARRDLYISDSGNQRVRVVTFADGKINNFAGGGVAGGTNGDGGDATQANLSNPGVLAVSPQDQSVFIADEGHNVIRHVVLHDITNPPASGTISTPIASLSCTSAAFHLSSYNTPAGFAFDKEGRLYVTGFVSDGGGCPIPSGSAVVARLENPPDAGVVTGIAGGNIVRASGPALGTQMSNPSGIAVDPAGNLYVAERVGDVIRKIDVLGRMTTIAGSTQVTGFVGEYGDAASARFTNPGGLAMLPSGDLLVLDEGPGAIRAIRGVAASVPDTATMTVTNGNNQTVIVGQNAAQFLAVHVVDGGGNPIAGLVVAWTALDPGDTVLQSTSVTNTSGDATTNVRVGFDTSAAQQHRFTARVQTALDPVDIIGSPKTFSLTATRAPLVGVAGTVAFLNQSGLGGNTFLGAGVSSTEVRMNDDFGGIARAADGTIFFADTFNHRVIAVSTEGEATLFAGNGTVGFNDNTPATQGELNSPRGLATDELGNVYIADEGNNRVRVVGINGNITTFAGGAATNAPLGDGGSATGANIADVRNIAFDVANHRLLILDFRGNEVRAVDRGTGVITAIASGGNGFIGACSSAGGVRPASFNAQHPIAVDGAGNIFVVGNTSDGGGCPVTPFHETIMRFTGQAPPNGPWVAIAGTGTNNATNINDTGAGGPATALAANIDASITGLAILPNNDVVFSEQTRHRVRRVVGGLPQNALTTIAGQLNNAGFSSVCLTGAACLFNAPENLLVDPTNGDVYVSDGGNEDLRLIVTP